MSLKRPALLPDLSRALFRGLVIPPLPRIENRCFLQAYEPIEHGRAIPRDVLYIGAPDKCRELLRCLTDGTLTQGQVKELFKKEMEPRPIAEQLKAAEKLAQENRGTPATKKDTPDRSGR